MNRARREIKTPKRFDDEPFEKSRKSTHGVTATPATTTAAVETTPVKSTPEPVASKSIIKIKLTKSKPRESPLLKKEKEEKEKEPVIETPEKEKEKEKETKEEKKEEEVVKKKEVKETIKEKEIVKKERDVVKKEREIVKKEKKEYHKPEPKEKELEHQIIIPSTPKILPPPQKKRRPRTPPVFTDIIPNKILPFWDARTAAEDHEDDNVKELVHCQCGIAEELGLMVQCETCLTWQHAQCLGIEKPEDAPDGYTCQACCDPRFARDSMRWSYDQDWLLKGRMKQFACDSNPLDEQKVEIMHKINRLIDTSLRLQKLTHSLKVKSKLLANASDEHPELKMFKDPWPANYQHSDGTPFVSTINHIIGAPPANIPCAMVEAAADPCDIQPMETVADAGLPELSLPEISQLVDVSAILDNTDIPTDDCRSNLRLHIQQTEEFITNEMKIIERSLESLEKQCLLFNDNRTKISFDSLKSDLGVMRTYITNRSNKK